MTTENNSAEIINAAVANTNTMSKYTVEIADDSGHSTFADLDLVAATEKIISSAEKKAHWVYINGEKFEFTGSNLRAENNVQKLQQQLQVVEEPNVLLTGVLRGGEAQE